MESPRSTGPKSPDPGSRVGYLGWSRDPAVGLFVIAPLWLCYEVLRRVYVPGEMNLAEYHLHTTLSRLPPVMAHAMHIVVALTVLVAAWSVLHRRIPWGRVGLVVLLEGTVYGLMLGPVTAELTRHSLPALASGPADPRLVSNLIGALGAGIFEELVFRLALLSAMCWLLFRASDQFGVSRWPGLVLAIGSSAAAFSLFHHVGPGAPPIETEVFVFRTVAGVLLGVLFVLRGIGVCVYTHAMYDVFFYLQQR
ncbi:MAG: CPBP family intramembrane metalloprotease [Planctomycetes bacterium]|nr:CPBP family intramembrane metalloprotease [Planctomycetota bacterium]